ncbi:MAG: hypothetical protein A2Y10_13340 [Planctomycetes bacterium GWF2_41_51]|nr:MAG: hypothetical protein A2Y10_13340 [Planctomycetes bacterium GWF2_41_51]HBG26282.1 hypothetical protein [Phycisphaerales bacterium]
MATFAGNDNQIYDIGTNYFKIKIIVNSTHLEQQFGPRFDNTAYVDSVWVNGKSFLREKTGLTDEFGINGIGVLNYDQAKPQETFIKIGVGELTKLKDENYRFSLKYPVVKKWPIEVTNNDTSLTIIQKSTLVNGYAYQYKKTYTIDPCNNLLTISYELQNIGSKKFEFGQYNHNWFNFNTDISNTYSMDLGFKFAIENFNKKGYFTYDNGKLFPTSIINTPVYVSSDMSSPALANKMILNCSLTGQQVTITGDFDVERTLFYAQQDAICPEVFVRRELGPEQITNWTRQYEFKSDLPITIHRQGWEWTDQEMLDVVTDLDDMNSQNFITFISNPDNIEKRKLQWGGNNKIGWAEYKFMIPANGWFELLTHSRHGSLPEHDVFIDNECIIRLGANDSDKVDEKFYKEDNVYLTKGEHTIRFRRLNHPGRLPDTWKLVQATGNPAGSIFSKISSRDIIRVGEPITIDILAGTSAPVEYSFTAVNRLTNESELLGIINTPAADKPSNYKISHTTKLEGPFHITVKANGKELPLYYGMYISIDTKSKSQSTNIHNKELIHNIDCIKQTDMGKQLEISKNYWEAYGKTRIVTTESGTYREGGDNLDANIPVAPGLTEKFKSGFSYAIDVHETQTPYLLEVDIPDDDRRTSNVIILEDAQTSKSLEYPAAQLGSGYETGDWFRLSNKMYTHRVLFWPSQLKLRAAIVSMNPGMRPAAAAIRVYKLDIVPMLKKPSTNNRQIAVWMEERGRHTAYFRVFDSKWDTLEKDYIGIQRFCQMCIYSGINTINTTDVIYQQTMYPSNELEGYFTYRAHPLVRLTALMCEKYNMKYVPELHLTGTPWFDNKVMPKLAKSEEHFNDMLLIDRLGNIAQGGVNAPRYNALHPAIQEKFKNIVGELADLLNDSPAFEGVSCRLMSWVWPSWNALPGLSWGYGDWTIKQFEKDTGYTVPQFKSDTKYQDRFEYLTSEKMLDKWLHWRAQEITAYLTKLRDRINAARTDTKLFLPYYEEPSNGMDAVYGSVLKTPKGALYEAGIDLNIINNEECILLYPSAIYGRRNSTPTSDQAVHDTLFNIEHKNLTTGQGRGFAFGNAYFEHHEAVPIHKLGLENLEPGKYCGAAEAVGRNMLEKFSLVLADQDTTFMRIGGLGYTFGQSEYYNEWFSVYKELPNEHFSQVKDALDPVAVWQLSTNDRMYFYAVNRESYNVEITIKLERCKSITPLGSSPDAKVNKETVTLQLKPYQLVAYYTAHQVNITNVETVVPENEIKKLKNLLIECHRIAKTLKDSSISSELKDKFNKNIKIAQEHYKKRWFSNTRAALSNTKMIEVYEQLADYPQGLYERRSPLNILRPKAIGRYLPEIPPISEPIEILNKYSGNNNLKLVDSSDYYSEWAGTKLLTTSSEQIMLNLEIPFKGKYNLSIGYIKKDLSSTIVSINVTNHQNKIKPKKINQPEKAIFPNLILKSGQTNISIQCNESFAIYGLLIEPVYTPIDDKCWATIGPFTGKALSGFQIKELKAEMLRQDPPLSEIDFDASYKGEDDKNISWQFENILKPPFKSPSPLPQVHFLNRAGINKGGICYGVTFIDSPDEREAQILIASDWWANAYLNDETLKSNRVRDRVDIDGSEFTGWTPLPATVQLHKGLNKLVIQNHGGRSSNWYSVLITNPGDLKFFARRNR